MAHVTSRDGTPIAFDRTGAGPALVLVGGGLDDGAENAPLAVELAAHFTVLNYARRGRGESGDTLPYALEREFEDLEALINELVNGTDSRSVHVYGVSTGGALALEAAAAGVPGIGKLAVYEVPYNMAADWPRQWQAYVRELHALLEADRRGDALALFMRLAGTSEEDIAEARKAPFWPGLEPLAPTLAYDAACAGDGQPPTARLARIAQPTLVVTGDERPADAALWVRALDRAADTIAASIPHARRATWPGQSHVADPKVAARELGRFFAGG
ncbi:alpha/beta fold hydrolase [Streptomyces sp. NPDC059009]|uniref:alpha/beta fold hydrolase n=1 Tax=Streptomyces sp. NPDC059009 TaxID=3346694 RepID=UPI0036C3AC99